MKIEFICPFPNRWNEIYEDLKKEHETSIMNIISGGAVKNCSVDGPPTPLILNGWVFSNDNDKQKRWQETLQWAEKHNLLYLTTVEDCDRCFSAGHTRYGGIQLDEYRDYTNKIVKQYKLNDYVTLNQYLTDSKSVAEKLPDSKGIYFVIYPYEWPEDLFLEKGTGGHFKGKNPNVSVEELWGNWVEDADILYIGKAGGVSRNGILSKATLKERIIALLRFGNGKNIGHWGGRYLWQHEYSADFRIYWYTCIDENPVELEETNIIGFEKTYQKRPFANLK